MTDITSTQIPDFGPVEQNAQLNPAHIFEDQTRQEQVLRTLSVSSLTEQDLAKRASIDENIVDTSVLSLAEDCSVNAKSGQELDEVSMDNNIMEISSVLSLTYYPTAVKTEHVPLDVSLDSNPADNESVYYFEMTKKQLAIVEQEILEQDVADCVDFMCSVTEEVFNLQIPQENLDEFFSVVVQDPNMMFQDEELNALDASTSSRDTELNYSQEGELYELINSSDFELNSTQVEDSNVPMPIISQSSNVPMISESRTDSELNSSSVFTDTSMLLDDSVFERTYSRSRSVTRF